MVQQRQILKILEKVMELAGELRSLQEDKEGSLFSEESRDHGPDEERVNTYSHQIELMENAIQALWEAAGNLDEYGDY